MVHTRGQSLEECYGDPGIGTDRTHTISDRPLNSSQFRSLTPGLLEKSGEYY